MNDRQEAKEAKAPLVAFTQDESRPADKPVHPAEVRRLLRIREMRFLLDCHVLDTSPLRPLHRQAVDGNAMA